MYSKWAPDRCHQRIRAKVDVPEFRSSSCNICEYICEYLRCERKIFITMLFVTANNYKRNSQSHTRINMFITGHKTIRLRLLIRFNLIDYFNFSVIKFALIKCKQAESSNALLYLFMDAFCYLQRRRFSAVIAFYAIKLQNIEEISHNFPSNLNICTFNLSTSYGWCG